MDTKDIKPYLNRESVTTILQNMGYVVNHSHKTMLREERSASALINIDGTIHDYGDNFHNDIFEALQKYMGLSFQEAKNIVMDHLGLCDINTTKYAVPLQPNRTSYNKELTDQRHKQIVKTMEWYDQFPQTFRNELYKKEALMIAPLWVYKQSTEENITFFNSITNIDSKNKTMVIKIHNYAGKLISYKRRRFYYGKWVSAKDTHPNSQCLVNIPSKEMSAIYIVEGHHDYLTAVLLGINVLMIPTVNYKSFSDHELSFIRDKDAYFIPDLDKGKLDGVKCMEVLKTQVGSIAKHAKLINLRTFLERNNIHTSGKVDLSIAVELWTDPDAIFSGYLQYFSNTGIYEEEEIF